MAKLIRSRSLKPLAEGRPSVSLQYTSEGKVLTISLFGADTPNGARTEFLLRIPEAELQTVFATMKYLIEPESNPK